MIINFLTTYWLDIVFVVVILAAFIIAYRAGLKRQVKQILLNLVIEAEERYGGKTGELKFSAVATWIYEILPPVAKLFLTAKTISELIENAVTYMKKYLSENESAANIIK
jgi:hypothetical protein